MNAVILTKSAMRKNNKRGSCVVAYDTDNDRLVRFTGDANGSPLKYSTAGKFNLLDHVSVDALGYYPRLPQSENFRVDENSFRNNGSYPYGIKSIKDRADKLITGKRFMDDPKHKLSDVSSYDHSFEIIEASNLSILKYKWDNGDVSCRASFYYSGHFHQYYSVTDPEYDIRNTDKNILKVGNAFMVVSIPALPWNDGAYYKFIAAIYPKQLPSNP